MKIFRDDDFDKLSWPGLLCLGAWLLVGWTAAVLWGMVSRLWRRK